VKCPTVSDSSSENVTPVSNKQSLHSCELTDSLNQTRRGRIRLPIRKSCSIQSHLSSELPFTRGIRGLSHAELSRSGGRRGIVVCNWWQKNHCKSSQQHVFPLTVLCRSSSFELRLSSQPVRVLCFDSSSSPVS